MNEGNLMNKISFEFYYQISYIRLLNEAIMYAWYTVHFKIPCRHIQRYSSQAYLVLQNYFKNNGTHNVTTNDPTK